WTQAFFKMNGFQNERFGLQGSKEDVGIEKAFQPWLIIKGGIFLIGQVGKNRPLVIFEGVLKAVLFLVHRPNEIIGIGYFGVLGAVQPQVLLERRLLHEQCLLQITLGLIDFAFRREGEGFIGMVTGIMGIPDFQIAVQ